MVDEIPDAVVEPPRRRIQLVWIIPIVAALVGAYIAITTILAQGPTVTISFRTAEGLEAGKTKIRYKDVEIGLITHVALARDAQRRDCRSAVREGSIGPARRRHALLGG